MRKKGFTLIEILVVVAIIGLISTVVLANVLKARQRGEDTHLLLQLKQIEKAFVFSYIEEDRDTWWTEAEIGIGGNPTLTEIIAIESGPLASFSEYFKIKRLHNLLSNSEYEYDYDGDSSVACGQGGSNTGANRHAGVNLVITEVDLKRRESLDRLIDGEVSPSCGKITYHPGQTVGIQRVFYKISLDDAL